MFRIFLLLLMVSLCSSRVVRAQKAHYTLHGKVISQSEPVEGVIISASRLNKVFISDRNGAFTILHHLSEPLELQANQLGYKPWQQVVQTDNDTLIITLEPDYLNLSQVVVSATRSEMQASRSPVKVNSIGRELIQNTQSLALSDALSFSPGLRVENNCQNCGFTQVRMNGLEGAYSQILINGRPVFSSLAAVYGLEMIPTSMIERVEVVRGGGSTLYGTNAIAGTVNIITKSPSDNSIETGTQMGIMNGGAIDRNHYLQGSVVNANRQAGVSLFYSNRNRQALDVNGDGFSDLTQLNNHSIGLDGFVRTGNRSRLKLNAIWLDEFRRGGNDLEKAPHESDLAEQLKHKIFGTQVSFDVYSADSRHAMVIYSAIQTVARDSYYGSALLISTNSDGTVVDNRKNAYGISSDVSLVNGIQHRFTFSEKLSINSGIEQQMNRVNDEAPGYQRRIEQSVMNTGVYTQALWDINERLNLIAGLRSDWILINGNYNFHQDFLKTDTRFIPVVPRLALRASLNEQLNARMGYARGYRAPQAFSEDLHIESVGGSARFIRLSSALQAEHSDAFSSSLTYTKEHQDYQFTLTSELFYTLLQNPFVLSNPQIIQNGLALIEKTNGDGARVYGLNQELLYAYKRKISIQAGFTLQQAQYKEALVYWEDEETGAMASTVNLLRTPFAYGYLSAEYRFNKQFNASVSGNYTGSMWLPHVVDAQSGKTVLKATPGFWDINTKLNYSLSLKSKGKWMIFAGVMNIFNSFQNDLDMGLLRDAGYVYGPLRPRTVFAGMQFSFSGK